MKNIKKISRKELMVINGGGPCTGCPTGLVTCDVYNSLPVKCKICVMVSPDCFEN